MGDIPASYVSLPEGIYFLWSGKPMIDLHELRWENSSV